MKAGFLKLSLFIVGLCLCQSTHAQLGKKLESFSPDYFDKPVYKVQKYGREFVKLTRTMPAYDMNSEYLFLNSELVSIKIISTNEKVNWHEAGEDYRKLQWETAFDDEKVHRVQKEEDFTAYFGENGSLLMLGKGRAKGVMVFESAKMRFVTEKWIDSQIALKNKDKKSEDGVRITFGGKKESDYRPPQFYNVAPGGAVYDGMSGRYLGHTIGAHGND